MNDRHPRYDELYFGESDGQNEAIRNPEAFVRSFVNPTSAVDQILTGEKYLVLGPKGAGKSALAWYLKTTESIGNYIVTIRDASTLPLADIPRLRTGQPQGEERSVTAWKFILLSNFLELLLKDPSCTLHQDGDADRLVQALRSFGFTGGNVGKTLLTASSQTFKIPIPTIGEIYSRENSPELDIFHLTPHLERLATSAQLDSKAILVLDGLDSIFLNDGKYDVSLSSLVQAAYNINQAFRHHEARMVVAILMRNDVFSRVSTRVPDSQKMRDDSSIQLDWRILSGSLGLNSPLVQLVNSKAARALEEPFVNVLSYFPKDIQLGPKGSAPRWDPTLRYLLNLTRHTPRDLLRLFESIRQVRAREGSRTSGTLSRDVIREGVLRYSSDYFVGAIANEMAGFERGPEMINAALAALQAVEKRIFTRNDYLMALKTELPDADLGLASQLLRVFFMAGAIGNRTQLSGKSYMQFYHRRDDLEVHLQGSFVLANPLTYAWSGRFSG